MNKIDHIIYKKVNDELSSRMNEIRKTMCDDDMKWKLYMSLDASVGIHLSRYVNLMSSTIYGKFI